MPRQSDAERYYDAIRDPDVDNIFLGEGSINGFRGMFIVAEDKHGDLKPLALILDKKTLARREVALDGLEDSDDEEFEDDALIRKRFEV